MNAPAAVQPHPINLRAIYIDSSQTTIDEDFDPLIAGQQLHGWHSALPDGARLKDVKINDTGQIIHTLEFKTKFEFVYRTPQAGQALPKPDAAVTGPIENSPEEFERMRLAARVSASIVASFIIPDGVALPDSAAIVSLAHTTVLSVTWPYWREFCQTAFHRMQMPQTLVPLLTIINTPPALPAAENAALEPAPIPGTSAHSSAIRKRLRSPRPNSGQSENIARSG